MSEDQIKTNPEGKPAGAKTAEAGQSSLLDQLVETARIKPDDAAFSVTKQGLQALIAELLEPQRANEKLGQATVDDMIAQLDQKLCAQVDSILHHESVQKLESAWRSLKFLVYRTNFRENTKIDIVNISKQKLLEDFEDRKIVIGKKK
jgi:type VI secretion system protein ImpC